MFLLHCQKCHHEWESSKKEGTCDWCGAGSYLLVEHHFDLFKIINTLMEINENHPDSKRIKQVLKKSGL